MHDPVLFLKLIKWLMGDSDKVDSNLEYFSKTLCIKIEIDTFTIYQILMK